MPTIVIAQVIGSQPATLQLRYLQTLTEIAAEKNSTVVFPLPLELLEGSSTGLPTIPRVVGSPKSTWSSDTCMTTTSAASDAERPVEQAPETPVIKPPVPPRLRWRVVVRTGGQGKMDPSRPSRPLAWHLVTCTASEEPDAHCPEGRRLLATGGDPDGHCLLDDVCPRCAAQK